MKHLMAVLFLGCFITGKGQTIHYSNKDKVLFSQNQLTISEFTVSNASLEYMNGLQDALLPYEKEIRFEFRSLKSESSFEGRIAFIPAVSYDYLVKILTFLEIEEVTLKDNVIKVFELTELNN